MPRPGASATDMAIVHEWIDAYAGSEQVFEALAQTFPAADLYALSRKPGIDLNTCGRRITTTFLDRPGLRDRRNATLPVMPLAWRRLDGARYDVVISSHHAFAHTNRLVRAGGLHLSYVHSPARYIWSPEIDSRGAQWYLTPVRAALKQLDRRAAGQVTSYAANSRAVADRIARFWGRDATVISPPVRVGYFGAPTETEPKRDYLLGVGRWITYKNVHMVAEVADVLGMPAKIAGRGPDRDRIVAAARAARVPVEVVESPSDQTLRELYRHAACLVFPTVEDFGMVPVEAQAAGTPVVALPAGGALETVSEGVSGVFAERLSIGALADAVRAAIPLAGEGPRKNAQQYSPDAFRASVLEWVAQQRESAG